MGHKIPESVLVVIHSAELEVLLIERADAPGYWQSVTGSKDTPDEALAETAAREVGEETGIKVVPGPLAGAAGDAPGGLPPGSLVNCVDNRVPFSNLRDWNLSNVYEIYPVWRHRYAPGVTRNTEHVFGLLVPRAVPVTLSPREHVRHVWLPYREAADRCFSPSNAEAILLLPNHFRLAA